MANIWERAAHSVNRTTYILFVLCPFVTSVVSHFGFEGRTVVSIAPDPGHCLTFYLSRYIIHNSDGILP